MDHAGDGRRHIPARGHFSNPRNVDSRGTKDPTFQVRQLDDVTSQRTSLIFELVCHREEFLQRLDEDLRWILEQCWTRTDSSPRSLSFPAEVYSSDMS